MLRIRIRKGVSLLLTVMILIGTFCFAFALSSGAAGAWNGTNYGGGIMYGTQTFLQAFGINYDKYMNWLTTHDAQSSNSKYYLGTPYVGYVYANGTEDHRVPNGDSWYNMPSGNRGAYPPSGHGMQCTGFVWHVLYKAQQASGNASRVGELPGLNNNTTTWYNRSLYRIKFEGSNAINLALKSGVLEKGDIIWVDSSDEWHTGIFYGETSSDNKFWNSSPDAGKNEISKIKGCGSVNNVYVLKVTQPNYVELKVQTTSTIPTLNNEPDYSLFGAKYCIFTSQADAKAAASRPHSDPAWNKRIGTMVTNKNGYGAFRTGSAPDASNLGTFSDSPNYNHEYFSRSCMKSDAKLSYYAVQWSASKGYQVSNTVLSFHEGSTNGKNYRTGTGYRYWFITPLQTPLPKPTEPAPTAVPTLPPATAAPTEAPTVVPTDPPTETPPTEAATEMPTEAPADSPTEQVIPTDHPDLTEVPTEQPTVFIALLGDADGNGIVNIEDATCIQRYEAEMKYNGIFGALMNADVDGDGESGVLDAAFIQRYLAGITIPYPIGEPIPTAD